MGEITRHPPSRRLHLVEGEPAPHKPSMWRQGRDAGYRDGYATARQDLAEAWRGFGFALFLMFVTGICAGLCIAAIWAGSV